MCIVSKKSGADNWITSLVHWDKQQPDEIVPWKCSQNFYIQSVSSPRCADHEGKKNILKMSSIVIKQVQSRT